MSRNPIAPPRSCLNGFWGVPVTKTPRVLTALPVYNEMSHVDEVLDAVLQYADDVLVVNDGSTDGTAERLARRPEVAVITHLVNQGYGAGLRSAFEYALAQDYDILVTIDCDGQHEPALIPKIAERVFGDSDQPIDIVSGSRYLQTFDGASIPPVDRRRINAEITAWLNCQFGWNLTDAFCGFKAYRVDALSTFQIDNLGYAMPLQLWVQAAAAGLRIVEFPVPLVYLEEERSFGGSLDDASIRRNHYFDVLRREMSRQSLAPSECAG